MHKPEIIQQNETRKTLKRKTDHLIPAKRPDVGIVDRIKKKTKWEVPVV